MKPRFVQPVHKEFRDSQELARAILDIEHLIARVRTVDPQARLHSDPEVDAINEDVTRIIARVFGTNSVQFNQLGYLKIDVFGSIHVGMDDREWQAQFARAHPAALAKLDAVAADLRHQQAVIAQHGVGAQSPPAQRGATFRGATHITVEKNFGQIVTHSPGSTVNLTTMSSAADINAALADLRSQFRTAGLAPSAATDVAELIELVDEQSMLPAAQRARNALTIKTALHGLGAMTAFLADAGPAAATVIDAIRHWFGV